MRKGLAGGTVHAIRTVGPSHPSVHRRLEDLRCAASLYSLGIRHFVDTPVKFSCHSYDSLRTESLSDALGEEIAQYIDISRVVL